MEICELPPQFVHLHYVAQFLVLAPDPRLSHREFKSSFTEPLTLTHYFGDRRGEVPFIPRYHNECRRVGRVGSTKAALRRCPRYEQYSMRRTLGFSLELRSIKVVGENRKDDYV